MPMTRTQRADYHAQYAGWSPHERAYFISRLFGAAHSHDIHDGPTLRRVLGRIATQMNANFSPRRFTLASLRDMLHHIRLDYVDFCEFLENPWVDYDPYDMKVMVLAPYWETVNPHDEPPSYRRFRMHGEPHYMRMRYIFDIKRCAILPPEVVRNALAIIPINLGRGNVPETTPSPPPPPTCASECYL
ncbi:hypothetical protein ACJIZ3_023657 [Penstemon smallii]|uniref:Uncharacterized protein n=1 Tax=Penstemon smallii TaxID=265156 RepID=A0ABD3TR23_9LAMI